LRKRVTGLCLLYTILYMVWVAQKKYYLCQMETTSTFLKSVSPRQQELMDGYLSLLNEHILQLKTGAADRVWEVGEFAARLHVHPTHLSNVIYQVSGKSPCAWYEEKLVELAQELILTTPHSIADIARHLDYDPSNFSKFFKRYVGVTPKQFREAH
jgi:AraC family transcriptional regulator of adaptative response / methylphosphotriester-DNA alkyltransferase methyltransferase